MGDIERRIGWNWVWFGPVSLLLLYFVEIHEIHIGFLAIKMAVQRWSWGGLFSPSAYFCFSIVLSSVWFPFQALLFASSALGDDRTSVRRRFVLAAAAMGAVIILPAIADTLIWGSFPFTYDQAGVARLRLIPFLPWPTGGYMTF
jgi:hypothetical protein